MSGGNYFWASWLALARVACAATGEPPPAEPMPSTLSQEPAVEHAAAAPDYSGDWLERAYLSGDWGGLRDNFASAGLTLDLTWTQIAQGIVASGRRRDWDYGGNLDIVVNADLGKMKAISGASLTFRGESRYAESVNDDSGAFTPVNTRGYFPLAADINEAIPFAITELSYTQSLSDTLEVMIGKMLTAEGDPTEFGGGLGRTQFFNSNFIYNAATSQTAPYSTLGAAVDWTPVPRITFSGALFATTDSSTTTGFDHLDDGLTFWAQAATQYRLGGLPGGINGGFQYGFDNQFTRIDGKLTLVPGAAGLQKVSTSWAVFCGMWQYLYTPDTPPEEIDATDGHADIRGVGLFARLGFADPDANPVKWSASVGLGGRGMIPGRDDDSFGVGYYYTRVQNLGLPSYIGLAPSAAGFEAYYNFAVTPAIGLTLDFQQVEGGLTGFDAARVLGVRLNVEF